MMIIRDTAIPLSAHPYSSTSRVVQWLTRHHGRISTILKGAMRPRSSFLGEYQLFGTSELLYYRKRTGTLHVGKECALLEPRQTFRTDWRASLAASYITSLFIGTIPDEAPQPELFGFYEELLDLAQQYGHALPFIYWMELVFCDRQGHRPNLGNCTLCPAEAANRFSAASGGVVCIRCARAHQLPTLDCPPDVLAILRSWQRAAHPRIAMKTRLSGKQQTQINTILAAFMARQFNLPPEPRSAATGS